MTLFEKRKYVEENLHKIPQKELDLFNLNFAYANTRNSASMEGYDITLEDVVSITKGAKRDGTLARSVYNHYLAYEMVSQRASQKEPITEDFIKDVHERLLSGIIPGGLYRNVDLTIKGSAHIPCSYIKVYDRMGKYIYDINHYPNSEMELIAYTHLQLAKIHPFLDGNGRLARLMLNYQLIAHGFTPICIPIKRRKEYFDSLEQFKVNKTMEPFITFLTDLLNKEYDRWILLISNHH